MLSRHTILGKSSEISDILEKKYRSVSIYCRDNNFKADYFLLRMSDNISKRQYIEAKNIMILLFENSIF